MRGACQKAELDSWLYYVRRTLEVCFYGYTVMNSNCTLEVCRPEDPEPLTAAVLGSVRFEASGAWQVAAQ